MNDAARLRRLIHNAFHPRKRMSKNQPRVPNLEPKKPNFVSSTSEDGTELYANGPLHLTAKEQPLMTENNASRTIGPIGLSNWAIDDTINGPALTKVLGQLIMAGTIGNAKAMRQVSRIWNLYQHGYHQEFRDGMPFSKIADEHVRGSLEPATTPGVKIKFIDEIGSTEWRKVADEYAIYVISARDGRPRTLEIKPGSHKGWNNGVVRVPLTEHSIFFLHPDLIARDVSDKPVVEQAVELVEP